MNQKSLRRARQRWDYIKSLPANTERYFHISAFAKMVHADVGMPLVPWVEKPGVTLVLSRPARRNETNTPRLA